MREHNFTVLRMRVRRAREFYDLLRVDHVVGLYRTYSYPLGEETGGEFEPPNESAQRAQGQQILQIVLAEAGPMQIVAEDLGLIPDFVRETLAFLAIPGYKVLRWEKERSPHRNAAETSAAPSAESPYVNPACYQPVSLATTGTHDTDTLVAWWMAMSPDERRHFAGALGISGATCDRAVLDETTLDAILESLYASPAKLAVTPIQDLFGWNARINQPGTISDANWAWRLPFDLERAMENPAVRSRIARILAISEKTGRFPK